MLESFYEPLHESLELYVISHLLNHRLALLRLVGGHIRHIAYWHSVMILCTLCILRLALLILTKIDPGVWTVLLWFRAGMLNWWPTGIQMGGPWWVIHPECAHSKLFLISHTWSPTFLYSPQSEAAAVAQHKKKTSKIVVDIFCVWHAWSVGLSSQDVEITLKGIARHYHARKNLFCRPWHSVHRAPCQGYSSI